MDNSVRCCALEPSYGRTGSRNVLVTGDHRLVVHTKGMLNRTVTSVSLRLLVYVS